MQLDEVYEISMLIDFYGKLLKEKHLLILQYYYGEDYSLSEIAEQFSITRQGVHDLIRRTVEKLRQYEKQLGLIKRFARNKEYAQQVNSKLHELERYIVMGDTSKIEDEIKQLKDLSEKLSEE